MNKVVFKNITSTNLYNITQDYCHYVILDLRPKEQFLQNFIRQSYWLDVNPTLENIEELIKFLEKKEEVAKTNDVNDKKKIKVRRLIVVNENIMQMQQIIEFIKKINITNFFNRFGIFDQLAQFKKQFPFLVLSIDKNELKEQQDFKQVQNILMQQQKQNVLYANSSFPLCVSNDQIFYGSKFHYNSKKILDDLNIKYVYEIVEDKDFKNEIVQQQDNKYNIQLNSEKFIDFENLWNLIEEKVQSENVLFIESNPKKHFPSFLIVYFIMKQKLNINIATMKVLQILGEPMMNLLSYNQAMNFIQGSVKRV